MSMRLPGIRPFRTNDPQIERLKMPVANVHPQPATRRSVTLLTLLFAVQMLTIGAGTLYAIDRSDNNTRRLDERSAFRDAQFTELLRRLDSQQQELTKQATDQKLAQERAKTVTCVLITSTVTERTSNGQNSDRLISFLRDYGCPLPPAVVAPTAPRG